MTEPQALQQAIHFRFNKLSIGLAEAQKSMGEESAQEAAIKNSVQNDPLRELLRIEKQAMRDKELNKKSEQNFVDGIRDMVQQSILERMQARLADEATMYRKILGFDDNLPPLLDILSVKASSISRIEPVAATMPWLFDDLLKMVNMPKYRRTDAKGKVVTVDTLRVALSFLGIENLKMVVPSLALRRWIPQITDPFPEIKTRIWESAVGTALTCKKIAEVSKVDPGHAFTLGLFHDIGRIVVIRLYFRLFDEVQREALIEAHDEKKREEYAALTKITPSSEFIVGLLERFATPLTARLVGKMQMKRVFIGNAMQEYADNMPLSEMSDLGKVLKQGAAYNRYRMLKHYKLINMEEAKGYLRQFQFPPGALSELKTTDIRHLNLQMDES